MCRAARTQKPSWRWLLMTHSKIRHAEQEKIMQLDDLFKNTHNLPTVPEVVRELIKSFGDETVDIASVSRKIAMDQVLMARVLRLANCARYGLARRVASVDDAIMVMGFNNVRVLVVASGLSGSFKAPPGFNLGQFWRSSLAIAGYASWIAKKAGKREDIAFTGGMILHVGILLLQIEAADAYQAVEKALPLGGNRFELEKAILGLSHAEVGAELARRWNFPEEISEGVLAYANPLAEEPFQPYAAIFHVADHIATSLFAEVDAEGIKAGLSADVTGALDLGAASLLSDLPELSAMTAGLDELLG